jgi:hypothetical protein
MVARMQRVRDGMERSTVLGASSDSQGYNFNPLHQTQQRPRGLDKDAERLQSVDNGYDCRWCILEIQECTAVSRL